MYICICNQVTDKEILDAANQGATTLESLCQQLNVGTCCGRCTDCAHELLESHSHQQNGAN